MECPIEKFQVAFGVRGDWDKEAKYKTTKITTQKNNFSIKVFFSKCDQIRSFLRIWSHLLKKSWMENFIFCAVDVIMLILGNCSIKTDHWVYFKITANPLLLLFLILSLQECMTYDLISVPI